MNRFIYIAIGLFIINIIFSLIPYLAPRAPPDIVLPYQLWFNVLFVFAYPHQLVTLSYFINDYKN